MPLNRWRSSVQRVITAWRASFRGVWQEDAPFGIASRPLTVCPFRSQRAMVRMRSLFRSTSATWSFSVSGIKSANTAAYPPVVRSVVRAAPRCRQPFHCSASSPAQQGCADEVSFRCTTPIIGAHLSPGEASVSTTVALNRVRGPTSVAGGNVVVAKQPISVRLGIPIALRLWCTHRQAPRSVKQCLSR